MQSLQYMFSAFIPDTTFGLGSVDRLGETVKRLGYAKPVIITDASISKAGLMDHIKISFKESNE